MAGKTIADGYVELRLDDSKLDAQTKNKAARVAKDFGSKLNSTLSALSIDPIDMKADPRQALQAIDKAESRLRELSRTAETVEVRFKADTTLAELTRLRKRLGEVGAEAGPDAAVGFVARFGARVGPLMASAPLTPAIVAAAAPAAAAVGGLMAAGVIGGSAGLGLVGGMALAARDERVSAAGTKLSETVMRDLEQRASRFVEPMLGGIERVRVGWTSLGPDLNRVFASSRFVEPLVDGAITGARRVVGGIADAVDEADPVIEAFRQLLAQTGNAAGDAFTLLAQDARAGASSVEDLTMAVSNLITTTAGIIHVGAQVKNYADELDKVIDKGRYWIEDNNRLIGGLEGVNGTLDLTADGFTRGSAAAEAYRAATLGTANAADFAALKQAGMTDAAIAAADASGTYRGELEKINAAAKEVAAANGLLVATQEQVTAAQQASTLAQQDYTRSLEQLGPRAGAAAQLVNGLRTAATNMFAAAIAGVDANEAYEASWDALSESVKANKGTLDIHTKAGRTNRDALQALLAKSNEMYFANIAQGESTESARKKHVARTEAVRKEAVRLGLNREETRKLIETYGKIPPKKTTDLVQTGLAKIASALTELYVYQRSLAEGIPVESVRALMRNRRGADKNGAFAGRAAGGPINGPGARGVDSVPIMAAPGEYMHRTAAVDYYGVAAMEAINAKRIPKEALRGYATGGLIAPVDVSKRWPFVINVSGTDLPSRKEVASKVTPPGPPSAAATGPWIERTAKALVAGLRVLSGYRPGARTLSGNQSLHATNDARDFNPSKELARKWDAKFGPMTTEFISPYQQYNRLRGMRHTYTGAVWNQHNFAGGNAHDHIGVRRRRAADNGGALAPGWNPPIYNGTGRLEPITPAPVMDEVVAVLRDVLAELRRVAPGVAGAMAAAVGASNYAMGRQVGLYTRGG